MTISDEEKGKKEKKKKYFNKEKEPSIIAEYESNNENSVS
jgi:hypothetical protein